MLLQFLLVLVAAISWELGLARPQDSYGAPQAQADSYGAPQAPVEDSYGSPVAPPVAAPTVRFFSTIFLIQLKPRIKYDIDDTYTYT